MEEKYTKQTKAKCSVVNNDKCFPQNLMNIFFFFLMSGYMREKSGPRPSVVLSNCGHDFAVITRKKEGERKKKRKILIILNMTVYFLHNLQQLHTSQPISFIVSKPVLSCYGLAYFSVRIVQSCVTGMER